MPAILATAYHWLVEFEGAGEKGFLLEGLGRELGVNARAAEEEKFFDARFVCAVDEVVLDGEVVVKKVNGLLAVGHDAADLGGGDEDVLRLFAAIEFADGGGIQQIELGAGFANQMREASQLQVPPDGAANRATVAGNINACISRNRHIVG